MKSAIYPFVRRALRWAERFHVKSTMMVFAPLIKGLHIVSENSSLFAQNFPTKEVFTYCVICFLLNLRGFRGSRGYCRVGNPSTVEKFFIANLNGEWNFWWIKFLGCVEPLPRVPPPIHPDVTSAGDGSQSNFKYLCKVSQSITGLVRQD